MNNPLILKHDMPGAKAGTLFYFDGEVFYTDHKDNRINISIPRDLLEAEGQAFEDWFEVESDKTLTLSQALKFGEHIKELCKSEQTVKPYYELQKFLKKL